MKTLFDKEYDGATLVRTWNFANLFIRHDLIGTVRCAPVSIESTTSDFVDEFVNRYLLF